VLNKASTLEHRDLRKVFANLNTHHVATEWSTIALFAATALNQFGIGFNGI
jgi:hypothetical protein